MRKILALFLLCLSVQPLLSAAETTLPHHNMVVSAHPLASQAGMQALQQGGNAFDAAAAVALSIGVVEPMGSGIGGGGFFLLYIAKEDRYVMLDARETSPILAGHGEVYQTQSSINGPQAAGVPGLLAGVDHLIEKYGRLPREMNTFHAISLARGGFAVDKHYQAVANWRKKALQNNMARHIYLRNNQVPPLGTNIQQKALAETLVRFAQAGADDFYRGETAGRLIADMKRDGGLIREADLAAYRVIEREPVRFFYQDFEWVSASLPSSGGLVLAETLGILQDDDLSNMPKTQATHLLIEAMKLAYRDRNAHLADADQVNIPDLLHAPRLKKLRQRINSQHSTPSSSVQADPSGAAVDTTHFSIIDQEGNMVSATLSINYGFGSAYVSPSTGILLNDEMDDFATKPGQANAYGLVQGKANAVAPHKRMLSSMSPTFIVGKDKTMLLGTPGGSRIISMVLLSGLAFVQDEHDLTTNHAVQTLVNQPRFHHQYLPDVVQYEAGAFSADMLKSLQHQGHQLQEKRQYGNMQAIIWDKQTGKVTGAADSRGQGSALHAQ
ncbi:MAG: gamma-glutamyltransferase [Mariprofundaceae bacterium]|nr:gamma-glutamyltransferase [Mariprofundaceae bacterium]